MGDVCGLEQDSRRISRKQHAIGCYLLSDTSIYIVYCATQTGYTRTTEITHEA